MLEVILSVITPAQLLTGKVIGLSAAGLLQVSVYLLTTAVAMPLAAGTGEVSASTMLWSGAIFLAGYALFATLLAGIGAMVRDAHENTQVASACLLLAAAPFFFLTHVSSNSSSVFARVLTWFPPTAPATLLLRMGSDGVGTAERGVALATIVLSAGAVLAVSAFLFKWRMLSGERLIFSRLFATGDRP